MSSHLKDCTTSTDRDSLVAIGVIRKPHGVRGEASVEPWTSDPTRFDRLENVFLISPDGETILAAPIRSVRHHGSRVLLGVEGIETPEAVRHYSGWSVEIPEGDRLDTDEDEYYLYELENLDVVDTQGNRIGTVISVSEGGGGLLLAVRTGSGREFDLPFVKAICKTVDLDAGQIVAEMPEGLDEIEAAPIADKRESRRRAGTLHDPLPAEPRVEPPPRSDPELRLDVVTIFPSMFEAVRNEGVLARAIKENIVELNVWDLREFAIDRHRSTDDEAYGGGAGMVMLAEPFFRCLDEIRSRNPEDEPRVILMSPQGEPFLNQTAQRLARAKWLVVLCGRYEGVDERVRNALVDEEISIGDYVVSGGELPAMVIIDAVSRMVEDVVGDRNSVEADSFYNGLLDHPHYTRPAEVRGMNVPDVLLSGHAERIRQWRRKESLRATLLKRPDLLDSVELDEEGRAMLGEIESEARNDR